MGTAKLINHKTIFIQTITPCGFVFSKDFANASER